MKNGEASFVPPDIAADAQAVADSLVSGQPLDPETYRRIRERGKQITEELRKTYRELNIGVPAIRELRGFFQVIRSFPGPLLSPRPIG